MLDIDANKETLVKQKDALRVYLDSLFRMPLLDIPDEIEPSPLAPIIEKEPAALPVAAPAECAVEPPAIPAVAPETLRPDWANKPFSCLLFQVSGLELAVPLVELEAVKPWPARLDHIPGAVPWILGVMRYGDHYVKVVDTAVLLHQRTTDLPDSRARERCILVFGERNWGLACDSAQSVVKIDPASVKWRPAEAKRPWVVGTAALQLCSVLNVRKLAVSLNSGLLV